MLVAFGFKKIVIKEWSWHFLHNWLDSKSRITSWHALLCPVERPCEEPRCYGEWKKHAKCLDVDGDDFVITSGKNVKNPGVDGDDCIITSSGKAMQRVKVLMVTITLI